MLLHLINPAHGHPLCTSEMGAHSWNASRNVPAFLDFARTQNQECAPISGVHCIQQKALQCTAGLDAEGIWEISFTQVKSGMLQLHRPDCIGEGRSICTYSMVLSPLSWSAMGFGLQGTRVTCSGFIPIFRHFWNLPTTRALFIKEVKLSGDSEILRTEFELVDYVDYHLWRDGAMRIQYVPAKRKNFLYIWFYTNFIHILQR